MEKMKLNIQLFGLTVTLTSSESAVDDTAINTNQTYVNLAIRVQTTKPTWNGEKTAYYQVTTTSQNNGTQTGNKYKFSIGSSTGSGDKTFNVTLGPFDHNADGTLNDVSISVYVQITSNTHTTKTKSQAMATIPRASTIQSITSGTTDFAPTLTWTPYSSTFKYIIRYLYGSWTYQTDWITPNSTNPQTFNSYTITSASIGPYIPNSTSATIVASLYTYTSDGHLVGSSDANFVVTLNANVKPIINSRTLTENGSTPSAWNTYVKSKSKVRVQTNASGIYGSTITSIVTTLDGYTYSGGDITSNFLNTSGSLACVTTITDSRGRQASVSTTISVQDYYSPTFNIVQVQRCDVNGNADDSGNYAYFYFKGSVATCNGNNKGTYKIKYKVHSASTYTEKTIASNVQALDTSGFITDNNNNKVQFDATLTYDFIYTITDQWNTSPFNKTLETGFDLINFNASGKALAFGKYSEAGANQELIEIAMQMQGNTGSSWISGRDYALLRQTRNSIGDWQPVVSSNTINGDWCIGTLGNNDSLMFAYTTDSNYSGGYNDANVVYIMPDFRTNLISVENFIQVSMSAGQSINQEYVKLNLDAWSNGNGSRLTLDSTNHRVVIGAGVSKVKVSAKVFMENVGSWLGYAWVLIRKNGTTYSTAIQSGVARYFQSVALSPIVINVSQGDYIEIMINNSSYNDGTFTIRSGADNTSMLVEVVG